MIDGSKGVKTQLEDFSKLLDHHRRHADKKAIAHVPKVVKVKPEYVVENISRIAAPAPRFGLRFMGRSFAT